MCFVCLLVGWDSSVGSVLGFTVSWVRSSSEHLVEGIFLLELT